MMRIGKIILMVVGIMMFWLSGCSQSVRYTQEEIKDYPPEIQENIIKGDVMLGMTPKQVRYAWGAPDSVKQLEPLYEKSREEWGYNRLGVFQQRRLLFIDGKLTYIIPEPQRPQEVTEPQKTQNTPEQQKTPEL